MTQQQFTERYTFSIKTDKIGGGSFGTVYKAYDNVLDREVAIKVSEVKYAGDKEFSLLEEFKAIENIAANPFIANYEEVFRFESFQGIFDYGIMQYYPMGNLSSYLKNNTVTAEARESIVLNILDGIAFLHQNKVVHRDLKPSNILVVNRRGKIMPKITDFGLSKQASADAKGSRFTNSFAGGTLQYSSPEQIKGLPLKLNTDLWSFGAIAYEILTGYILFEAESNSTASAEWQNEITNKILHEDVTIKLNNLSQNWQKTIESCLERDLAKRTQTVEELLQYINEDSSKNEKPKIIPKTKQPKITEDAKHQKTVIKGTVKEEKTQIKDNSDTDIQDNKPTITKVTYWHSFFKNPSKMKWARLLSISLIVLLVLFFVQVIIKLSSLITEEEFNEYQPDYNPDFTILDIFFMFCIGLWLMYTLGYYLFSIRIKLGIKILIPVLLFPLMLLFEFLGNITLAIFMLYILLSPIYWIIFWVKHRNFKKSTHNL